MMSAWLGGAFVNRDKKGDPGDRTPIEVVPVDQQRAALRFVMENAFRDEAFGLTPDLLRRMTVDKWLDDSTMAFQESTWPVHDRVMGIQAMVLTRVLNPGTLGWVYDNEFLTPADQDMITLPEVLKAMDREIWSELDGGEGEFTERKPMISSLRRNLQREYVSRLVDLSMPESWGQAAHKALSNLALMHLRALSARLGQVQDKAGLDAYSRAHLVETKLRIDKALEAGYTLNGGMAGI
jgi:hypothetical protein